MFFIFAGEIITFMITFFSSNNDDFIAVEHKETFSYGIKQRLEWLFGGMKSVEKLEIHGLFIGPRKEMITPWSTNAVEITMNMGITGITRLEQFTRVEAEDVQYDRMLAKIYKGLDQQIFFIDIEPEQVSYIDSIADYNKSEGLALSDDEIEYLEMLKDRLGRKLTDSEVFGFSQVNSEHCRHKIFNGTFIIDGLERQDSLFSLIKKSTNLNTNMVVSAYKDNVAFIEGPEVIMFSPERQDKPCYFTIKERKSVISLKAETHNFPTTVEPFNGAATGTGGEIRDRLAGGKGSLPIAGTAVYFTSYPRLNGGREWEKKIEPRKWLYQNPEQILIKASNGASDFGNKYGQPLITGSLLTFEHVEKSVKYGFDKVVMLAGGVGYAYFDDALKGKPEPGDLIVVMGGDNYRIGMGGSAVSSVDTGEFSNVIELNAVQRSNPEMQKRVANVIRAMVEADNNSIVAIHDHGAGGHLNSLSELIEKIGGVIDIRKLPVGDPTLSAREILGNESQERMGLIIKPQHLDTLTKIAERERAPMYVVGEVTGDKRLIFVDAESEIDPINLELSDFFGKPPQTVMSDSTIIAEFTPVKYDKRLIYRYVELVLQLEAVACKDWLTNKVDRSVTGKVATQQCTGELQLPLNNVAVVALDYSALAGIATSIGHAPAAAIVDPAAGSRLAITEAITNIMWAQLTYGINGVSLSANWMWPCKNKGEDARLYKAVEAASDFAIQLGINIPTGKDSLSMTQKYPAGEQVRCPGTVIISAVAETDDITKTITPDIKKVGESKLIYINFSTNNLSLGGSSFAQVCHGLGNNTPDVEAEKIVKGFMAVQKLIRDNIILAGHDISAGGLITTLLEMTFPLRKSGMEIDLSFFKDPDIIPFLFSEQPGAVIQVKNVDQAVEILTNAGVDFYVIGKPVDTGSIDIVTAIDELTFDIAEFRDKWYKTSYLLDRNQSGEKLALSRFENYKKQPVTFKFPDHFTGKFDQYNIDLNRTKKSGIRGGIIREKGVNGDREMAWSMHLAGFDVRDIHMTDLINGRETLDDLNFIVFTGGFSNSDVLGSAKGWAGAFLFNKKAKDALERFYARTDTLSLGICNGCQLMVELELLYQNHKKRPEMLHNDSGKFESAFLSVDITDNNSVMLKTLAGSRLGIWIAHGEGKFSLPMKESEYCIPAKYSYSDYPGNPNGSDFNAAAIVSHDGRHLAMMPHFERSIYPYNWAIYPENDRNHEVSPWIEVFVNALEWIKSVE